MIGGTVISSVEEEDGDRARLAPTSGTSNTIEVILTMAARDARSLVLGKQQDPDVNMPRECWNLWRAPLDSRT